MKPEGLRAVQQLLHGTDRRPGGVSDITESTPPAIERQTTTVIGAEGLVAAEDGSEMSIAAVVAMETDDEDSENEGTVVCAMVTLEAAAPLPSTRTSVTPPATLRPLADPAPRPVIVPPPLRLQQPPKPHWAARALSWLVDRFRAKPAEAPLAPEKTEWDDDDGPNMWTRNPDGSVSALLPSHKE